MKKIQLGILICLILGVCSCSEEEVLTTQHEKQPFSVANDSAFFRNEADAVFSAINAISKAYPNDTRISKSKKSLTVKNVKNLKSDNSQSINSPGFYIINFEGGGFAMIPNDIRATEVYAYSDEGSLSQGANDGVDYFLESANDYLNYEINNSKMINGYLPITPAPTDPNDPRNYALVYHGGHYCHQVPKSTATSGSHKYLLNTKWHQRSPYYNLCLNSSGEPVSAGCVPIALGQIMAYHQKPASYNDHTYSWDLITQKSNLTIWDMGSQSVAELIYDIGTAAGINYWGGLTGTSINEAYNALNSFGYNRTMSDYSYQIIANNINSNRPCYVRGDNNENVDHAWVIDGYRSSSTTYVYYMQTTLEVCSSNTVTNCYVHCNWGWGGTSNGFFLDKAFADVNGYDLSHNLTLIHDIYQ